MSSLHCPSDSRFIQAVSQFFCLFYGQSPIVQIVSVLSCPQKFESCALSCVGSPDCFPALRVDKHSRPRGYDTKPHEPRSWQWDPEPVWIFSKRYHVSVYTGFHWFMASVPPVSKNPDSQWCPGGTHVFSIKTFNSLNKTPQSHSHCEC